MIRSAVDIVTLLGPRGCACVCEDKQDPVEWTKKYKTAMHTFRMDIWISTDVWVNEIIYKSFENDFIMYGTPRQLVIYPVEKQMSTVVRKIKNSSGHDQHGRRWQGYWTVGTSVLTNDDINCIGSKTRNVNFFDTVARNSYYVCIYVYMSTILWIILLEIPMHTYVFLFSYRSQSHCQSLLERGNLHR